MKIDPSTKYRPFTPIALPDRQWPSRVITAPPVWCSVDLRDGNQALIEPMDAERKLRMFRLLVKLGYKEIEIGFPAASQTDFDFVRKLVEEQLIPDDVDGAGPDPGARAADPAHVRVARRRDARDRAPVQLDVDRAAPRRIRPGPCRRSATSPSMAPRSSATARASSPDTDWIFQYSPESFTGTELDFAIEVCDAVDDVWQPTPQRKMIINLPATVEMATPNVYADQIEWMSRHLARRDSIVLSLHPHNDRGCGVAAAELGVMAGAERIEGACSATASAPATSASLPSASISTRRASIRASTFPTSTRSSAPSSIATSCRCIRAILMAAISCSPRSPARTRMRSRRASRRAWRKWRAATCLGRAVPADRSGGRGPHLRAVIRVNSQSGKGGIAYLLERDYGLALPRLLQIEFSQVIQRITDATGKELSPPDINAAFDASTSRRRCRSPTSGIARSTT